nr:Cof-type HAD-IIB family hydrolase [Neobacillus sp. Marseille-Q6967]
MNQKLILFDVDGTLITHDKKLPLSNKRAVQALIEKGHVVAIATGRASSLIYDLAEELNIDTYVSFNGQCAVVKKNEVIYKKPLPLDSLRKLSEAAASKGHPIIYMGQEHLRSSVENHKHIIECYSPEFSSPPADPLYFEKCEIYQSQLFMREEEEHFYRDSFEEFKFIRWHPLAVDIVSKGGSKVDGIASLVKHLGISKEDVFAFGDGINDIEMFQFAGKSVAMGNAPDVVKKAATYVTKDILDDGIYHGLKHFGLLK